MDPHKADEWVKQRLATLDPAPDWSPNEEKALARLDERCRVRHRPGRVWMWSAVSVALACACLLIFPSSWDAVVRTWAGRNNSDVVYVGQVYAALAKNQRQLAPDFALKNIQGDDVRLSDYRGHVVVLNFWASWCLPCKTEVPWLSQFQDRYRNQGLVVIGVAVDDGTLASLKDSAHELGINYQVVSDDGKAANSYSLSGLPMTYVIDRDGNIVAASAGIINRTQCEAEIVRLLKVALASGLSQLQ